MPLVVLCGLPCSGKSTRAQRVAELIRLRCEDKLVHVIAEDFTTVGKSKLFSSVREEKIARANLKSQVERLLSPDSFVILDSLNYIKGYRYELYCVSKHLNTTQCTIFCDTPAGVAREWNCSRGSQDDGAYTEEVFDALVMRFETPDSRNRWDKPLFVLLPEDELPAEGILDSLIHSKPPPPNQSTQNQPLSPIDFLHELDRQTQAIVGQVLAIQQQCLIGAAVTLACSSERLCIRRAVTMAELRQARRQFISYTKLHPVEDVSSIPTLFIQYLNNTL